MSTKQNNSVWYKEPWPWFFFGLLGVSVVFSLIFVSRSLSGADDVVVGDYYKEGLGINDRLQQYRNAENLGVQVVLDFQQINETTTVIHATATAEGVELPAYLQLKLMHPVEANYDIDVVLTRRGEAYMGEIDRTFENRWYIRITGPQQQWMLRSDINLSYGARFTVTPND